MPRTSPFLIRLSSSEAAEWQRRAAKYTSPYFQVQPGRVENRYKRGGAWVYLSALEVHNPGLFGRCETVSVIAGFDSLVEQVMTRPPHDDARRVFWMPDNGSGHRGAKGGGASVSPISWASGRATRSGSHSRELASIRSRFTFRRAEKGPHSE
jgi:hypothetical protein